MAAAVDAIACLRCGARIEAPDGIPQVRVADEDMAITREREAVRLMEEAPLLRPTDFSLTALLADTGPMLDAFASLPYDDGSAFYRENEYFQNVSRFAAAFDYVVAQLGPAAGGRLLDVGADITWSTARLAAQGWRAVGIDINEHLAASRALQRRGPAYAVINMDMHLPAFRAEAFDAVTAFNALHHTHRVEPLIGTLVSALRPGGRLGVVEPYWFLEAVRQAFGVTQIEAGINENIYRLEEWHRWFVQAGLELEAYVISHSFDAVYVKQDRGHQPRRLTLAEAERELFDDYYHAVVSAPSEISGTIPAGVTFDLPVTVTNRSRWGWSSEGQLPVSLGCHVYRVEGSARTLVTFGQGRTGLGGYLLPGGTRHVRVLLRVPSDPGDYDVDVDLVHENRYWFSERGLSVGTVRLHVV